MDEKKNKLTQKPRKSKSKTAEIREKKHRSSFAEKKEYRRKIKLNEINYLDIVCVIVPRDKNDKVIQYIECKGGVVIFRSRAKGVSRANLFSGLGINDVPVSVIFSMARREESVKLITGLSEKFRLDIPGNGKAFMIDVLGYMGAKAPFIEKR